MTIPFTSLQYHLNYLEKKGYIIAEDDGKYSRYFISSEIGDKEKKILKCLRQRTLLHLILCFILSAQCSQKDLSRILEKHPATIGFHLRKMIQAGIIEQVPITQGIVSTQTPQIIVERPQVSSEKIYVLKDLWMIYNILVKYQDNLGDKEIITGLIEYVEFIISEGVPKQILNREDTKESVINTLYAIFFPPSFSS
jgi:DNA-binding transcriptional ArsR family regulator